MLDDYVKHIAACPNSLLSRIYGVFTIRTSIFNDLDLIVMQNTARLRNKD